MEPPSSMPTSAKPATRLKRFGRFIARSVARFLNFATCFEGFFRIIWMIFTFGYAFPRRRVGENYMYCIVRHMVIFVSRLFCFVGAIYYIYRWMVYAASGDQRELNTLRRESKATTGGTLMPWFTVLSTEPNKINVTAIHYTNTTSTYYLEESIADLTQLEDLGYGWQRTGVYINHNLTNDNQEYFEVVLQHATTLPAYPWYRLNFYSPRFEEEKGVKKSATGKRNFTDEDKFNEYFYQPGHYVELRYTPIEVHDQPKIGDASNLFTKIKIFAGFGDEVLTYSYETTVSFKPFSAAVMAAQNYTADTTVIIIRPQSSLQFIYYHDDRTNFRDTMSSIGGLLALAGSVIAFLFGAGLLSPWGKLVEVPYFRRKVAGSLAKAYGSQDGISRGPFTGNIKDIGKFDPDMSSHEVRITLLKERMDELELVLTEYYLEGNIFQDYASERLEIKQAKHEALVHAGLTQNGVSGGVGGMEGGMGEYDIPLLPSQKMEELRRQSISGNGHQQPSLPLSHSRKFSDSAYNPQRQPLSPPLPVPQSRSSHYGSKPPTSGTHPSTHNKSTSEQSLLRQSDQQHSPGRVSDEMENNHHHHHYTNHSVVSLRDQHGQPIYQASPMSPTYHPPHQQQQQQQQQAQYPMSSSSSTPPSQGHSGPKEEFSQFSEIPVTTTHHNGSGAGAGAGVGAREDAWWSTTAASANQGENNNVVSQTTGPRHGGQGLALDMSGMPREP